VLSELGSGAMGMVLAAYDPELDRKAALKLLNHSPDRLKARERLRREAQALAKLNHANVLTVYDVGVHEGMVFLAMELVQGRTLSDWMRTADGRPRAWREVVTVFAAAGRGLAAVHATGLVHRDFKPDNVMLGDDGRVRVADFGLARFTDDSDPSGEDLMSPDIVQSKPLQAKLTRTGASLGTPAYMAPEQFRGHPATVHSDQFSFCVALFEALHGVLPFPGNTVQELSGAVLRGQVVEQSAKVPAWLVRVVRRGLAVKPSDRFADMNELLDALRGGEVRRRRLALLAVVGAVGLAVAGGLGLQAHNRAEREAKCRAVGDTIDGVWNDETRAAVRAGMLATGVSYAPTITDKLMPWLDRQAQAWREQATLACTIAEIERHWDTATYEKVSWCLEYHKIELEVLIDELVSVDAQAVDSVVTTAADLSMVAMCTDPAAILNLEAPPDPALRAEFADIHRALLRGMILGRTGHYAAGLELMRATLPRAEALGWTPLTAALRAEEALFLVDLGEYDEAEAVGNTAYMQAARSGAWDVAAKVAGRQAVVLGLHKQQVEAGKAWVTRDAVVALAHAGDPFGLRENTRLAHLSLIYSSSGEFERTTQLLEQVLDRQMVALGPEHPDVGVTLLNLGLSRSALGDSREAKALYERAVEILERALGPEHPLLSNCHNNLGSSYLHVDELDAAQRSFERALAIQARMVGPEHPMYANTVGNLARVHARRGDEVQGELLARQALAVFSNAMGPDSSFVASERVSLAGILIDTQRFEAAEHELELARASLERGPDPLALAASLLGFGDLYAARGELERARASYERALELYEHAMAPEHPDTASALYKLGRVHEQVGNRMEAREFYECALEIRTTLQVSPSALADARFALARVLVVHEPMRAHELVEQALLEYGTAEHAADALAEARAWLNEHPV
jgi:tetratricopeptide (TPR) repeat protein/predicted Ser/Thr protein kinase